MVEICPTLLVGRYLPNMSIWHKLGPIHEYIPAGSGWRDIQYSALCFAYPGSNHTEIIQSYLVRKIDVQKAVVQRLCIL